jgi:hypothetical protein
MTAICCLITAVAPRVEMTYAITVCTYNLITGMAYAVGTAFFLEMIGTGGKSAATRYTVYNSAANFGIGYVGFIDTRFHDAYGVAGPLVCDAILNLVGVLVLGVVFWKIGLLGKRHPPPELPKATASEK